MVRRAVDVAEVARSGADGGWGEDCAVLLADAPQGEKRESHRLADGLGAARADGGRRGRAARRSSAASTISRTPRRRTASWDEERYTAVGFPRVFYLRYHGYRAFFPLWALARYRNLTRGNEPATRHGM